MRKCAFVLTLSLLVLGWLALPAEGQDSLPETPAAEMFAQLLEVINDDTEFESKFWSDGFTANDDSTVERRRMMTGQLRSQLGKLEFHSVIKSSDRELTAECHSTSGPNVHMTIRISEEAPYRIDSIALEMAGSPPVDESPLDAESRAELIERMAKELRDKYVFPDVGEEMASAIETALENGDYDKITDVGAFASQLSQQLREICNDKHLNVRAGMPSPPSQRAGRRPEDNHGFVKAEMLTGGIGYLKFNYFSGDPAAEATAAAAMNFLANSRALIFDLRQNGGGSPDMIAFLSTYLFPESVHLNSFYNRPTDTTSESWTRDEVPGERFGEEIPVFVLTSGYTFSGAEEFSYNLQNLKRGVIVGETTGGGAHPVMGIPIGKRLRMSMPFARAINPITKTNWEGVGVRPDVEVPADEALDRALELAHERIREIEDPKADVNGKDGE